MHLLARAVERDRGVQEVFKKAGADPADVAVEAESGLGRINKTTAGLAYLSNADAAAPGARGERGGQRHRRGRAPAQRAVAGDPRARRRRPAGVRPRAGQLPPAHGRAQERAARGGRRQPLLPATCCRASRTIWSSARDEAGLRSGHRARRRGPAPASDPRAASEEPPAAGGRAGRRQDRHRRRAGHAHRGGRRAGEPGEARASSSSRRARSSRARSCAARSRSGCSQVLAAGEEQLQGRPPLRQRHRLAARPGRRRAAAWAICSSRSSRAARCASSRRPRPTASRKMQERDPGLLRRFSVLTIEPPTVDQAIEILRGIATQLRGAPQRADRRSGAIVAAVRLAKRYLQDRALPDAAIDLLDETAARKRVEIDGVPADGRRRHPAPCRRSRRSCASLADDDGRDEREDARAPRERDRRARAARERDAREARLAPRGHRRLRRASAPKKSA